MLIGLTGKAQAGKDTVGKILVEEHGFTRIAFADALKRVLLDIDPYIPSQNVPLSTYLEWLDDGAHDYAAAWDWAKQDPNVRGLLQRLGVAVRAHNENYWVNAAFDGVFDPHQRVVVTDVRFPNEVKAVLAREGRVFRVLRDGAGVNNHISETALDHYELPEIANNSSLDDLRVQVASLVAAMGGLVA